MTTQITYYKVGGFVRDQILGVPSKDVDYAVEAPSFAAMREDILLRGGTIFLEKPQFQTIRAKLGREDADFVLCRKDGAYSDGRHPDSVEIGTIEDDLARRDFTMNAIALRSDGTYVDPFDGIIDAKNKVLKTVGSAHARFNEDPLRMLRAMRFIITRDFRMHITVEDALWEEPLLEKLQVSVSKERIREELFKCFKADTLRTLCFLERHARLRNAVFASSGIWLEPTFKQ